MPGGYDPRGVEGEFGPGPRGRVLRNRRGIKRVTNLQFAESAALDAVQERAIGHFDSHRRFTAPDIRELHRRWLGGIYEWAGDFAM